MRQSYTMVVVFNKVEKAELVILHASGLSFQAACEKFHINHPERPKPKAGFCRNIFIRFKETGSFKDRPRSGRPMTQSCEDKVDLVKSVVRSFPRMSVRKMASRTNLKRSTVHRILKRADLHPFRYVPVQAFRSDDHLNRLIFCNWFTETMSQQTTLPHDIIFSDESIIYLNGSTNRNSRIYWSTTNQHLVIESHHQYNPRIIIWCGVHNGRILGPYFFDGNVNAGKYLEMLTLVVKPYISSLGEEERCRVFFQQDGAPCHFASSVKCWLNDNFPQKWIGRGGPVAWPARSPDLTPMDFFFWSHLKMLVGCSGSFTIDGLKENIRNACRQISSEVLLKCNENLKRRIDLCSSQEGGHFEQLL